MGKKSATRKKTPARSKRSTLSPTIVNNVLDHMFEFFYNIIDGFGSKDQNERIFLEEQGYDSEKYFNLLDKKQRINQDVYALLHEVIIDLNSLHEDRKTFFIIRSKYIVDQLAEIKKNSEIYAINEIKQHSKTIYKINRLKYGFFKARRYTKKYFSDIDLEAKLKELTERNIKRSNYDIIEEMIGELRNEYSIERYLFQRCVDRLYKKYGKSYPLEFLKYDKKNEPILITGKQKLI
jgi:hypothetical protein